jgi:signal transduction histidine kinase
MFTSILFMMYDFFVRQEFHAKQAVIEAKRRFVRFVSHEVRTPLNAVCMGLALLQDDIDMTLSDASLTLKRRLTSVEEMKPEGMATASPDRCHTDNLMYEKVTEWLSLTQDVLHNTNSAVDVLNDLLNYDKIERGYLSLELTIIPIWSVIERAVTEFILPSKKKKINFVLEFQPIRRPFPRECRLRVSY